MFTVNEKIKYILNIISSYLTIKSLIVLIKNPVITRINLLRFGPYHKNYYPYIISKQRNEISSTNIKNINWSKFDLLFNFEIIGNKTQYPDFFLEKNMIHKFWTNSNIYLNCDIELHNASHRFKWLLFDLSLNDYNKNFSSNYRSIKKWFHIFKKQKNAIAWHPYNASERVCNLIIFFTYYNKKIIKDNKFDNFVKEIIQVHSSFLLDNLEYTASKITNNHILNNGRALYYISEFTENIQIKSLSKVLILKNLSKLLNKKFILDESSVHYHFLITMWVLEVYLISKHSDDTNFTKLIKFNVYKMLDACDYFLFINSKKLQELPKIGDVSPDMPLNWFDSRDQNNFGWTSIWNFKNNRKIYNYKDYKDVGWHKLIYQKWAIFCYLHPNKNEYPSGHGHDDFVSFLLYFEGLPILTDIGNFSYDYKNNGKSSDYHSIFTINNKPILSSGIGYKSPISSFSRRRVVSNFEKNNFYFKGKTLSNIHWQRSIKVVNKKTIFVEDNCENKKKNLLKGNFYLSKNLKLVSRKKNNLMFSHRNKKFSFSFDENSKIEIKKVYEFSNYGKKSKSLCISYTTINFMKLHINYLEELY